MNDVHKSFTVKAFSLAGLKFGGFELLQLKGHFLP